MSVTVQQVVRRLLIPVLLLCALVATSRGAFALQVEPPPAQAAVAQHAGGEANLVLPDLGGVEFRGVNGRTMLMGGLVVAGLGLLFGLTVFSQLKNQIGRAHV